MASFWEVLQKRKKEVRIVFFWLMIYHEASTTINYYHQVSSQVCNVANFVMHFVSFECFIEFVLNSVDSFQGFQ